MSYPIGKRNPDPLLSMKEAAEYLNISLSAMYEIAKREKLICVQITADRKIKKSVLDDLIARKEKQWNFLSLIPRHWEVRA
jgi:excisionase family DNA binding protein